MTKTSYRILLTNDDGYSAPGIQLVRDVLIEEGHRPFTFAPESQRSGYSHAITYNKPLSVRRHAELQDLWIIDGTPADCVRFPLLGFLKDTLGESVDFVISGLNHGANLGYDVIYSGTVAGARESVINKVPSLALSVDQKRKLGDLKALKGYLKEIINLFILSLNQDKHAHFWNVNIPEEEKWPVKGFKLTPLGIRHYGHQIQAVNGNHDQYHIIWNPGQCMQDEKDLDWVNRGYISITPLQLETTDFEMLENIRQLLNIKN